MTALRLTPEDDLRPFVTALAAGESTVLPTDTVYGLACAAHLEHACERTLALKGRDLSKPTSIIVASTDILVSLLLGDLARPTVKQARALLHTSVTLVLPNPRGIFPWLCGDDPSRIGVRLPVLGPAIADAIDHVRAIAATSANLAGQPDPVLLDQVPGAILSEVAVAIDGGRTPVGKPSTVVDLTGPEPVILREGALSAQDVDEIIEHGKRWWYRQRRPLD
jgi:tRNA threonylcarbamoyl adenosine modification protein (Sua5/YciO/YrdC/YwlC family)